MHFTEVIAEVSYCPYSTASENDGQVYIKSSHFKNVEDVKVYIKINVTHYKDTEYYIQEMNRGNGAQSISHFHCFYLMKLL